MNSETYEGLNILVIDDQPVARDMVRAILKSAGFVNVITAENAGVAESIVGQKEIHFIICDWNMPGMSGLAFLQLVRRNPKHEKTPFLMLTAEASKDSVEVAIRSGVTDYLIKPFTADSLMTKVQGCLSQKA